MGFFSFVTGFGQFGWNQVRSPLVSHKLGHTVARYVATYYIVYIHVYTCAQRYISQATGAHGILGHSLLYLNFNGWANHAIFL